LSTPSFVSLSISDHIGVVTLTRPEALNAISGAFADELGRACRTAARRDDVWAVILRAEGERAFCVGADLKERASFSRADYRANRRKMRAMFAAVRELPQPAIASIFGHTLGGGLELALSCDLVVAATGTELGLPEARVGLLPAGGGTQLLARRVGVGRAKELVFTGAPISAESALAAGLVDRVVPLPELGSATEDLARAVVRCSPVATRAAKQAIDAGLGASVKEGEEIEHGAWGIVVVSDDRSEGVAAFNEKRDPRWSNR
jgi:enoyl-CoA hydratase/carnithine racemase